MPQKPSNALREWYEPAPGTGTRGRGWRSPRSSALWDQGQSTQGWAWDQNKGDWVKSEDRLNKYLTYATIGGLTAGAASAFLPALSGAPAAGVAPSASGAASVAGPSAMSASSGIGLADIFGRAIGPTVGLATGIYGARTQANAAREAGELEAQAAREALEFLREQEATRKTEFDKTQAQNYGIYQTREANLDPYRQWGQQAMGQLKRPIPQSIGAIMSGAR